MGVGVAGLQAIATARRLGAVVTATDVRPATKEQVESLGAKFVAVEDEEFKQAETAGGYAKEMSEEYQAKQAELVASHIAKQDIVITTALIPGRPAPKLVTADMVESMRPGSVHRRPGGRARRQRASWRKPGEIVTTRERREDRRPSQRARPARRHGLERSTPQPLRLRRDADRQGGEGRSRSTGTTNSSRRRASPATARSSTRTSSRRRRAGSLTGDAQWPTQTPRTTPRTSPEPPPRLAQRGRRCGRRPMPTSSPWPRRGGPRRHRRRRRSVRVPPRDLRAGDLRRLLRGLVGDAGAAHAADVGDQRDLLGDRGRRAAVGRRRRGRPRQTVRSGRACSASSP